MSRFEYQNEYNKENYFKVALRIPKEKREALQELAKFEKVSMNKLIINAIEQFYNIDLSRKGDE
jgi:predicted HicB family RNase H-like nuclease